MWYFPTNIYKSLFSDLRYQGSKMKKSNTSSKVEVTQGDFLPSSYYEHLREDRHI